MDCYLVGPGKTCRQTAQDQFWAPRTVSGYEYTSPALWGRGDPCGARTAGIVRVRVEMSKRQVKVEEPGIDGYAQWLYRDGRPVEAVVRAAVARGCWTAVIQ